MNINPINFTVQNSNYIKHETVQQQSAPIETQTGLSNYTVGQAIYARNNIAFEQKSNTYNINRKEINFIPNKNISIVYDYSSNITPLYLNYNSYALNDKEKIVRYLTEIILTGGKYVILDEYYGAPTNENKIHNKNLMYEKVCVDTSKNEIKPHIELKEFENHVISIYKSDISQELEFQKRLLKEDMKYNLSKNPDFTKRKEIYAYYSNIPQIYETIDSVSDVDIKNFINKFFINQKPIIHVNKENIGKNYANK